MKNFRSTLYGLVVGLMLGCIIPALQAEQQTCNLEMSKDNSIFCEVQLNKQMKSFTGRLRIYSQCLRGKCSTQARSIVAKAALKDGAIFAISVAVLIGVVKLGQLTRNGFNQWLVYDTYPSTSKAENAVNKILRQELSGKIDLLRTSNSFPVEKDGKEITFQIQRNPDSTNEIELTITPVKHTLNHYECYLTEYIARDLIGQNEGTPCGKINKVVIRNSNFPTKVVSSFS